MDNTRHRLDITWAKAFGEAYCHHASLFIPFVQESLFDAPEIIKVGITVYSTSFKREREDGISPKTGRKIKWKVTKIEHHDVTHKYFPCSIVDGGLLVSLNSAPLIEALGLNRWTTLGDGSDGYHKEFPEKIFYTIGVEDTVEITFDYERGNTPYLANKSKISKIKDGETIDTVMFF